MAAAASYATHAIAHPAGQSALLAPKAPLPLLFLRGVVCLPSYAVSFSGNLTPLPAHRVACAPQEGPVGYTSGGSTNFGGSLISKKNERSTADSANLIMEHSKLICCKLYISESRNPTAIAEIDKAARKDPRNVVVLSKFGDYLYNRVRYTLVSYISDEEEAKLPITRVLLEMAEAAFKHINLQEHSGEHYRMGVIDDLSFHPLGVTKLEEAASLANTVANEIVKNDSTQVPVFLYGEAHRDRKTLSGIRRELSYYRPVNCTEDMERYDTLKKTKPDKIFGNLNDVPPYPVNPKRGATTVGATGFLEGYNVPVRCKKEDAPKVSCIARKLKDELSGGAEGFPKVLTIAVRKGDCSEVACLLDPDYVSANQVQDTVKRIAKDKGLENSVEKGYYTDITKDMILINLCSRTCQ